MNRVQLWKVKLKAAKAQEREWAKAYNQAERGMMRVRRQINELETKIGNAELAKSK